MAEFAAEVSKQSGKRIAYKNLPQQAYHQRAGQIRVESCERVSSGFLSVRLFE